MRVLRVSSRKKCLGGGKYLEIACHEAPCDFLEGVAHCILLISKHQASSGMWLKLALSLLVLIKQISMQYQMM